MLYCRKKQKSWKTDSRVLSEIADKRYSTSKPYEASKGDGLGPFVVLAQIDCACIADCGCSTY
jgi:hypothetical protein